MRQNDATARDSDATRDTTRPDLSRQVVALPEAARLLGVGVRTVQRRIERGQLSAIERDGKRFVALASGEIGGATVDATRDTKGATVTRHDATARQIDATEAKPTGASGDDLTARLLAQLESENKFLRAQLEAVTQSEAQTKAALREALRAMPKQITAGDITAHSGTENSVSVGQVGTGNAPQLQQLATGLDTDTNARNAPQRTQSAAASNDSQTEANAVKSAPDARQSGAIDYGDIADELEARLRQ